MKIFSYKSFFDSSPLRFRFDKIVWIMKIRVKL